jgi:hypothetical protein
MGLVELLFNYKAPVVVQHIVPQHSDVLVGALRPGLCYYAVRRGFVDAVGKRALRVSNG